MRKIKIGILFVVTIISILPLSACQKYTGIYSFLNEYELEYIDICDDPLSSVIVFIFTHEDEAEVKKIMNLLFSKNDGLIKLDGYICETTDIDFSNLIRFGVHYVNKEHENLSFYFYLASDGTLFYWPDYLYNTDIYKYTEPNYISYDEVLEYCNQKK